RAAGGNDGCGCGSVAGRYKVVPNAVGPRKVAALWVAIFSGSSRHCNCWVDIGKSNFIHINGIDYPIIGWRRWITSNVKCKVSCSSAKTMDEYQEGRVSIGGEGNLALQATGIVISCNAS